MTKHIPTKNQMIFLGKLANQEKVIAESYLDRRAARELDGSYCEVKVQNGHIMDEFSRVEVRLIQ